MAYPNSSRAPGKGGAVICPGGWFPAARKKEGGAGLCPLILEWWSGKGDADVFEEEEGCLRAAKRSNGREKKASREAHQTV